MVAVILLIRIYHLFLVAGAKVPPHIHCPSTLRYIFTNYVDFRAVPRKVSIDSGRLQVDRKGHDWWSLFSEINSLSPNSTKWSNTLKGLRNKVVEVKNTLLILRKLMYLQIILIGVKLLCLTFFPNVKLNVLEIWE